MPIYEYRCRACGKDFEKYVHATPTTVACPSCSGDDVMRKLSVFGLRADGGAVAAARQGGGGCCAGGCSCH
jgi:putative FmdB family regulatory protein